MMLVRTRREGTMIAIIIALCVFLAVRWLYHKVDTASKLQTPQGETIRGPNPDGSWGTYAEPIVQVSGVVIKSGDENEAMIFLVIDMGDGKKYGSNVTIPVYPLTKTDSTSEEVK